MIENWWDLAECKGQPLSLFFPVGRFDSAPYKRDQAKALTFCARCPVRYDCLGDAVARGEYDGVRGGLGEQDRQAVIRQYRFAERNVRADA